MPSKSLPSVDFKQLFESSPGLYLVLSRSFDIVAVSNAYLQATLTQRDAILGQNLFVVFPDNPDDATATGTENLRSSLERVLKTKKSDTMAFQKYDIPRPAHLGGGFETRYWSPFNSPVLGKGGEVEFIIHRVEDVTDFLLLKEKGEAQEKKFEIELFQRAQELQETNKKLRAAEQLKSEFLATMSHEIRTPMNGIVGMTEMILMTGLNPEQKSYAQTIQDSTMHLMTIINDILDFSKIEAGRIEFETIDFSPIQTIENQADLMATKFKSKGLSFTTYIDPEIPHYLKGDPGRIGQVLLNLISNAIKFTPTGSIFVQAELVKEHVRVNPNEPFQIRFSVTDTGIGIASDTMPQLFQPFIQGDSSTTRKFGGTGLGLSISKKLVSLMNGEMGVESTEGKGSCFWFTLPLVQGEQPIDESLFVHTNLQNLKILIAEEDPIARGVLYSYINSWGATSERATNSNECIDMLNHAVSTDRSFDLVFLGLGSFSLGMARKISVHPQLKKIKMILVSDYKQPVQKFELLNAGIRSNITKPFKQSQIFDCIISTISGTLGSMTGSDATPSATPPSPTTNRGRILLVEDNSINQKVAKSMLDKWGYSVHIAANGEEALQQICLAQYDLILMDCQMPVMDGFAATKAIRQLSDPGLSQVPIIALTANAMKGDQEKCLQAGMNDYISKPIQSDVLEPKVQQWIRKNSEKSKGS